MIRMKVYLFCCKIYLQEMGQNEQGPEVQKLRIEFTAKVLFFVSALILTIIRLNCKKKSQLIVLQLQLLKN